MNNHGHLTTNATAKHMDTGVAKINPHLRIEGLNGVNPAVYCDISDMKRSLGPNVTTTQPDTGTEEIKVLEAEHMNIVTATQHGILGREFITSSNQLCT